MNTYITLMKLTDQGAKELKNAPARIEEGLKLFDQMGGKLIGFYATMGEYDYIGIGEAPSDEAATTFNLVLSSMGSVRTRTIRAFSIKDITAMTNKLP